MIIEHLTDNILQEYASGNSDENADSAVTEHIAYCKACHQKVSQYRLVLESISKMEKPVFDFDLADVVMTQLAGKGPVVRTGNSFYYFLIFITGVCVTGMVFYLWSNIGSKIWTTDRLLTTMLIVTAGLFFLLAVGAEIVKKYREQIKMLNHSPTIAT